MSMDTVNSVAGKLQVSLVSLAEAAGVTLRLAGADLTGCCPFHEDGSRRW